MDSGEECPHGMGEPEWCSICLHGVPTTPISSVVAVFIARYPGRCSYCQDDIYTGDRIASMTDDSYRHEECSVL